MLGRRRLRAASLMEDAVRTCSDAELLGRRQYSSLIEHCRKLDRLQDIFNARSTRNAPILNSPQSFLLDEVIDILGTLRTGEAILPPAGRISRCLFSRTLYGKTSMAFASDLPALAKVRVNTASTNHARFNIGRKERMRLNRLGWHRAHD